MTRFTCLLNTSLMTLTRTLPPWRVVLHTAQISKLLTTNPVMAFRLLN